MTIFFAAYLPSNRTRMKDSLYLNNLTSAYCNKLSKIPEVLVVFACDEDLEVFTFSLLLKKKFFFSEY